MRGSIHDKGIREFTIDKRGMHMGRRFRNVTGILAGAPMHVSPGDLERVWTRFDAEVGERKRGGTHSEPGERRRSSERRGTS
jgi:circadian clock protein KaiC